MPKIALDVEGTIADIHSLFIKFYNNEKDKEISMEDLGNYYFENSPVTVDDFHRIVREKVWKNWRLVKPTEPEIGKKVSILNERYELDIVTGRDMREQIEKWLEFRDIEYGDLIIENDKTNLDYDIFIDDNPKFMDKLKKDQKQFLYTLDDYIEWTKEVDTSKYDNVYKVSNLADAKRYIEIIF